MRQLDNSYGVLFSVKSRLGMSVYTRSKDYVVRRLTHPRLSGATDRPKGLYNRWDRSIAFADLFVIGCNGSD